MIDLKRERVLTLAQAREHLPRRRGKQPAATTVWRWIVKGSRGVTLDGLRTPSGWVTSVEAISRFLAVLAALDRGEKLRDPAADVEQERQRRAWASDYLDRKRVGERFRRKRG